MHTRSMAVFGRAVLRRWMAAFAIVALVDRAPAGEATLYRDSWGVPHVYADTEAAGYYALGYAQAEDRLEDIYLAIREATGRMSEVRGKRALENDYLMRLFHNDTLHATYLETAPKHVQEAIRSFAAGIRAYAAEHPDEAAEVKLEVADWHPLAVGRAMILRWPIGTMMGDLRNSPEPVKPAMGSNQWAVAPSRSADGRAILLSDPHLTWEGLAVLYESRLHAGEMHTCGYSLVGTPMMAIGHNQHAGWALTTGGPDTSDVYRIEIRTEPRLEYLYDGVWKPMREGEFTFKVKDAEPVRATFRYTHLGPVISGIDAEKKVAYVGASPYTEQVGLYEQFYEMGRARDVHAVNAALSRHQYNEQNVMSADCDGNIAYVRNGATPVRPDGYDFKRPVDGTTSKTAWKELHPQSELVTIVNPAQGYMQNCNISPANMMVDSPLKPEKYPPHVYNTTWDQNNPRGRRTIELLHNDASVTPAEAKAYALDVHDRIARMWQAELRRAYEADPAWAADEQVAKAVEVIQAWDGEYLPEARGAALLKFWRLACGEKIDLHPLHAEGRLGDEARKEAMALFRATIDSMTERYGRWDIPWGEAHVVGRGGKYFPAPGADFDKGDKESNFSETLMDVRSAEDPTKPGRFVANSGSMAVILMFFGPDGVESFTCTPWGQSAHADSPHYVDQAEKLYSKREMKNTWWRKEDLLENVESQRTFRWPRE
jgi:acyl-homoserine-lactone acylase